MKIETLCREFIALTAGRVDPHAHGQMSRAVSHGNFTAAWPRARNIADGIRDSESAGFTAEEKHRLGELLAEIDSEWNRLRHE